MNAPDRTFLWSTLLLRPVLVATFAAGLTLHALALAFGRPWLLAHVLTPAVDAALVIPMAYAAAAGWALRRRVRHPSVWHRRSYLAENTAEWYSATRTVRAMNCSTYSVTPEGEQDGHGQRSLHR